MPQAKPRAHAHGPLARRNQAPRHEVDGADVVGVERVAQPERVGQDCGGDEGGEEAEYHADGGPDDQVDGDENGDLACDGGGEAVEDFRDGEAGDGGAAHGGGSAGAPGAGAEAVGKMRVDEWGRKAPGYSVVLLPNLRSFTFDN